jgi:hypothetical protein
MHPHQSFAALQKIFLCIGGAALLVGVFMTGKFGWSMSALHAFALCLVTICAAFIFPFRAFVKKMGHTGASNGLAALGVFFVAVELFSHLGYTIGTREDSSVHAVAHQAAYTAQQNSMVQEQTNLAMWREHLTKLQAENAWVATVSADGLRAQVAAAQMAIDQEAARGGCKSKCLARTLEKAKLEERIALAEQASDLSKKIEATQRILDKKTEVATTAKVGFSPVKAQTDFVGQMFLVLTGTEGEKALNPDAVTVSFTQIFIGLVISLAATFLAPASFYMAFFGHKPKLDMLDDENEAPARTASAQPAGAYTTNSNGSVPSVQGGALQPSPSRSESNTYIIDDRSAVEILRRLGSQVKERRGQLAEAV